MHTDDESDAHVSSSSTEYFTSPAQAKREALKRQLVLKGALRDAQAGNPLLNLRRAVLQSQIAGKSDEETKRAERDARDAKLSSFGTKTREQEIAERTLTADSKPTADKIVKQDAADKKTQEEIKAQEASSEDA